MLIRITDHVYLAHDEVACVEVVPDRDRLYVHQKNGYAHTVGADYGKGIWETQRRLVAEINACFAPRE